MARMDITKSERGENRTMPLKIELLGRRPAGLEIYEKNDKKHTEGMF